MQVTLEDIRREKERRAQQGQNQERARTMAQGLTFGFSDEIEAAVRSMVPSQPEYSEIRDELRGKLKAYKEQYPTEAITYELAGALVPSLAMMASGVGAPAAASNLGRLANVAKVGAAQGGAYGLGASEEEGLAGMLTDATTGAVTGAVVAPAIQLGLSGAGSALSKITNYVRGKFNEKAATAVQAELQRLVEQTGKSVEEIALDVAEGRLMSDNKTLTIALKNMVNEGGLSGRAVLEKTKERASQTTDEAMRGLQGYLAPNADDNVLRSVRASDDAIKEAETQAYQRVFGSNKEVSPEIADQILSALSVNPAMAKELNQLYATRGNIVPLVNVADNGAVKLARMPTLEDAEIVRRLLSEKTSQSFREGAGSMGSAIGGRESALRTSLDEASPDLAATRANASNVRSARDAFELGRLALSKNVDELELSLEQMNEASRKAFMAGLMDSIRNKSRRTGTTLANLADEDKQFGQVLRLVTGPEQQQLLKQLNLAGEVREIASKMPPTAGSPTAALTQERSRAGLRSSAEDASRMAAGDPMAVLGFVDKVLRRQAPALTDSQRMEVVNVVFSDNPELVRKALTDEVAAGALVKKVTEVLSKLSEGATTGAVQQSTGVTTEILQPSGAR